MPWIYVFLSLTHPYQLHEWIKDHIGKGLISNFALTLQYVLLITHWGRVTHLCISKLTIIGSDNGLSPGRRQAVIWTNAGILLIRTLGTNFNEMQGKIHSFSFKKMHLKMLSAKGRVFSLGLNELTGPGARFTNSFLPPIQIRWKLRLAITPLLAIRSQQIFAHATTAQLSCHVQNFVAITILESRWEWNEIFINLNCDGKTVSETGPWGRMR